MLVASRRIVLSILAFGCVGQFGAVIGAAYRLTEFTSAGPAAINDHGEIAGTLRRAPDSSSVDHLVYWKPDVPNGTPER
jgi:hypothetical protein